METEPQVGRQEISDGKKLNGEKGKPEFAGGGGRTEERKRERETPFYGAVINVFSRR